MTRAELLRSGLSALGVNADASVQAQLLTFLDLLAHWNTRYNLTAITDPLDMVRLHLLDSLTVLPYLHGQCMIDVATGAGLPGIPLALCTPEKQWTLLDSNSKRTRFIEHVKARLKLTNITVVHARVEDFHPPQLAECVITRAFTSLAHFVEAAAHLCAADGQLLAMKGVYPESELSALSPSCTVEKIVKLKIPNLEVERHLVITRGSKIHP